MTLGIGAGIGGGLGLVVAMLLASEPAFGIVVGAAIGVLIGLFIDTAAATRRRALAMRRVGLPPRAAPARSARAVARRS
jgi:hypothetical protein